MALLKLASASLLALAASASLIVLSAQGPASNTRTLRLIVAPSRAQAEDLRRRVSAGEDFAAVARAESVDASAAAGGLLGTVDLTTMRPELREAVAGTAPGQLSAVIQIPTGFAFLKVETEAVPVYGGPSTALGVSAVSSTGSVKYVLDVGGLPEAEAVLRGYGKPPDWSLDPRTICQVRQDSMTSAETMFENFVTQQAGSPTPATPSDMLQARLGLGQLLAYGGQMSRAVREFEAAHQLARSSVPALASMMDEVLGLAYLHKAEWDNGVYRSPTDLCLIPPRPGLAIAKPADGERAVQHFENYLRGKPGDLEVRWLLNLAYMTLGRYPDGVPAAHLIPPAAFASAEDIGRFVDVAPQAGLNVFASAGGVIVDDLSGDGLFDIATSNFYSCGPMHYFVNNGDGTYTERTREAGLAPQVGGLNLMQTDYNNDGCRDILLMRGGWEVAQRDSLLRNNCNGTFTDVTIESGLDALPTASQAAAWTDINNDGRLDLFVGNEDRPSQLYLNTGSRFEDISRSAGVDRMSFAKGVTAGDYDNDGFDDIYISNYDGRNILYHNNGNKTFTDTTIAAGPVGSGRGFPTWFFDYDNDGWLDIFASSYFMSAEETARTYLNLPHNATTLKLYRNLGNGTFRDVTKDVGLDKVFMPMGSNFGDADNDGFLDIYLGMGAPSFGSMAPHVLLRNSGGRRFVDITASSGTGELHKGHGIAFADLDHDGDADIVAEIGGATPGDSHAMRVFENPGQGNDWLTVRLVGSKSNRAAIGARISVDVENNGVSRSIHRTVNSGGTFGASPLEQHIGLGRGARIKSVNIWWPASNTRQRFTEVAANQVIEINEAASTFTPVARTRVRLGGAGRTP
jgi:hypothetical protein